TTATANDRVIADVQRQLGNLEVIRGPLVRKSLMLQTMRLPDQAARLAWLAEHVPGLPGSGIVYVLTRRDAEVVAGWLQSNGIHAEPYHSAVMHPDFEDTNAFRLHLENSLLENSIKVLVATSALGMGFDKPDLGFVIHYQAPNSVVSYYQQAGRAGRAVETAYCVMMSGREDDDIHTFFRRNAFPDEGAVNRIVRLLAHSDGLSVRELEELANLSNGQLSQALKYLSVQTPSPVVKIKSKWLRTSVRYSMDTERILHLTRQREDEWAEMRGYLDTDRCLMEYLCHALDDRTAGPCGRCSNCLGRPVVADRVDRRTVIEATRHLRRAEMVFTPKVMVAKGAFEYYPFSGRLPEHLRAQEGRILSRWGDAGWGRLVADDKHGGNFSDELVAAVAEMIQRWNPAPLPTWITCVESLSHPDLVPAFTRRLARRLDMHFVKALNKIQKNDQQKFQRNRFHQCRNLDGVFSVDRVRRGEAVFLVDDVIDSGWTMTILAALLLQAGSGPVFPVALASTSTGD
ncbi:RecQ family ATP-dependent DNA helicase, partial [bacterium]|nr:RecQ family ATP-dependent DNA helicase [candidate division CSSED10-310 bacterium]